MGDFSKVAIFVEPQLFHQDRSTLNGLRSGVHTVRNAPTEGYGLPPKGPEQPCLGTMALIKMLHSIHVHAMGGFQVSECMTWEDRELS